MNTIIIESCPLEQKKLVSLIRQQTSLKFSGVFDSVLEAYHILHSEKVDLIFVNMEIAGLKTMNFSKALNKTPLIIFSKSNQAFPFNFENSIVVDILTDLNAQRFQKAIDKAQKWSKKDIKEEHFFIRTKNSFLKLAYDEVFYIKAMENFVQIVTRKETFIKLISLKKLLEQLPKEQFVQVHRSYIVNVKEVVSIEKDCIKIELMDIPIGNLYKEALLKALVKQKLILR
jgi:two-component system, LytTR family, response regulator